MKIELYIDGEKRLFMTPYVPQLAKRKYLEITAKTEEKAKQQGDSYSPSAQDQLDEEDEMVGILANIVFGGQFTVEQVYLGASDKYVYEKLAEAVFGKKKENDEGNVKGE
ncbi:MULTISPECIES: hypothetical protein [unclassified Oceanobacillus]|uniref:phage tail assembly chaperone G n=1 Tax=unclassified Oceanobacillus TaxID=2630292 RepID=UPI001BE9A3D3|nr:MULTISPECIES: hypothetical protein [unclassified Oceanobacillus]MBT2600943.1 hypothetical protein [Oceanobacillus sp. ISL-74]MBT2653606.1 hypothetical protein [Oceanobacillus sp. ISL-73]